MLELTKIYDRGPEGSGEVGKDQNNHAQRLLNMECMEETHSSVENFLAFFLLVMPDMVGRLKFRRFWNGRREKRYEDLVSVADEGFGLLVLQNNLTKWKAEVEMCYDKNIKVPDSAFTPHARKRNREPGEVIPSRREGWTRAGLRRYNELCEHVVQIRKDTRMMNTFNAYVLEHIESESKDKKNGSNNEEERDDLDIEDDEDEIEVYSGDIELFAHEI